MKVAVVLNQKAGSLAAEKNPPSPAALDSLFRSVGIEATIQLEPPDRIFDAVRQAIAARPDAVFVGGGDGTVSSVAGLFVDAGMTLGVLPLGTLNHFAKDLGFEGTWEDAIAKLAGAQVRIVDAGEINGRIFLNNCSIGAYPEAVRRREVVRRTRGHGKWRAMLIASWHVLQNVRRLRVQLESDGRVRQLRAPFVLVSNNCYSGNIFTRTMRPEICAGQLWVYTTRIHRMFPLLRLAIDSLFGRMNEADGLETWAAKSVTIQLADELVPVAIDGEVMKLETPLRLRIRPRELRVLAPAMNQP